MCPGGPPGPIGLSVAIRRPGRFSGFVFGNTWAWPVNGVRHFEVFSRMSGSAPGKALELEERAADETGLPPVLRVDLLERDAFLL